MLTVDKQGFPDAVVWNPWAEKAKGMADFGDNEYQVHCFPGRSCSNLLARAGTVRHGHLAGHG